MIAQYRAQSRVGQSGELHHVATLLARHLGLRAHVARIAGRLRLVRLQKDVNLEMTGDRIFKGGQRKTSARLIFCAQMER